MCLLTAGLNGCQKSEPVQAQNDPLAAQSSTAASGTDVSTAGTDLPAAGTDLPAAAGTETLVDVDLTAMSSTMVYGEVFNITQNPQDYLGKTIKASGQYLTSYYDVTDTTYHYVGIADAAACCQQGLEFIWSGDHAYPDDYPAENADIEVSGVFKSYDELGLTYYYLDVGGIVTI